MASGPNRATQLGIERLDRVGGVEDAPDLCGKDVEQY
jgi:hypothetical protein